jgi:D-glycero-beta-D-manno-heptose 1-phosphate adenylyltransferase
MAMLTLAQAEAYADHVRSAGQRLVVTDGVFDLLLPGHVRALQAARAQGDALLVLVHADRGRQDADSLITPEQERAEVMASLAAVDAAVIVDPRTLDVVYRRLQPHLVVSGQDDSDGASALLLDKIRDAKRS